MKIKTKILLQIVGITVVILLAGGTLFLNFMVKNLEEEMVTAHLQQTDVIARAIKDRLEDEQRILEQVANTEVARSLDSVQADKYLASIVQKSTRNNAPVYSHILITNSNGDELVHSMGVHTVPPTSLKGRDYHDGAKNGKSLICMPNISKSTGRKVFPIAVPVMEAGQYKGSMAGFLTMEYVSGLLNENKIGPSGYVLMTGKGADGQEGRVIASPVKEELWNKVLIKDENPQWKKLGEAMGKGERTNLEIGGNGKNFRVSIAPVGIYNWSIAVATPSDELFNQSKLGRIRTLFYAGIVVMVLILVVVSLMIAQRIVRPINALAGELQALSEKGGDLTREIIVNSNDEIGGLCHHINKFLGNVRDIVKQVAATSDQIAAASEELTASAEQSAQAANSVAASIADVSAAGSEQLAAAMETATVVGQMSAGVEQMTASANQVAGQSADAAEKAKDGGKAVEKAVNQMAQIEDTVNTSAIVVAKLGERSKEIGQIVDAISGIAGQTNLLALNAAIEAARAGEQGRGFAVVAEEVRKLAEQSQDAAKKIAGLIGEIQEDTEKAVKAMNDGTREVKTGADVVNAAGAAFQEIADMVTQVSGKVRDISAAIQQTAVSSQQIVGSVQKIDRLSKKSSDEAQSVSAATEEQLASMEEIASSSAALSKLAQDLQGVVSKFRV